LGRIEAFGFEAARNCDTSSECERNDHFLLADAAAAPAAAALPKKSWISVGNGALI